MTDRRALPLSGKRIVVTRPLEQASELSRLLRANGADAIIMPAIRIEPLDLAPLNRALDEPNAFDWVLFTSQNAVALVWNTLRVRAPDQGASVLAGAKIGAIGPATANALAERGMSVEIVPERFVAEGLLEAMAKRNDVRGSRVLLPRAEGARAVLPDGLRTLGADVVEVPIYRAARDARGSSALARRLTRGEIDVVTFTSSSTVRSFLESVGLDAAKRAGMASIGPVTSATAREMGLSVDVEAEESTIPALVQAVVARYG
jgi:uroporphyrinogen-III synthase